jgi:dUTP pyrophosphatase
MVLKVRRLRPDAVLPRFAHPDDSGMDVCACEDLVLAPEGGREDTARKEVAAR